jgi:LAO/AO transport system ATPase
MIDALLERFRQGDRHALTRLLTLVSRGQHIQAVLAGLGPGRLQSRVVAVTGGGGVGKSTLAGRLIELLRGHGQTVGVLACDPQSPLSGGALLGDRFRMPALPADDGVFIRSLAAGGTGALARHLFLMIRLLEEFGFDVVIVETAGAGQGDTAVYELVDVVVLLLQPETGDDVQWEKAGLLEVADVIVINKADLPGAESAEAQVRSSLDLPGARPVPVLRVSGKKGEGIEALWQAVAACPLRRKVGPRRGQDLLQLVQETLAARFAAALAAGDTELENIIDEWERGKLDPAEAVQRLVRLLSDFHPVHE